MGDEEVDFELEEEGDGVSGYGEPDGVAGGAPSGEAEDGNGGEGGLSGSAATDNAGPAA